MQTLRRQLQTGVWLALVAVLSLALVPTLAKALAHSRGDVSHWAEVCTPQGMKQVAVDGAAGDEAGAPAASDGLPEHCAYCTLTTTLAPPPAPLALVGLAEAGTYVPPLFLRAPRSSFAWSSAQSRAPPSHS